MPVFGRSFPVPRRPVLVPLSNSARLAAAGAISAGAGASVRQTLAGAASLSAGGGTGARATFAALGSLAATGGPSSTPTLAGTASIAASPTVYGGPALIQQASGGDTSGYGLGTTAISTSAGSFLIAFVAWDTINTGVSLTTPPNPAPKAPAVNVTDSAGNLWQQVGISVANGYSSRAAIWACANAEPVSWVSVALTGYASATAWTVAELSGMPQQLDLGFSVSDTTAPLVTNAISVQGIVTSPASVFALLAVPANSGTDPSIASAPAGFIPLRSAVQLTGGPSGIALYPCWLPSAQPGTVPAAWQTSVNDVLTAVVAGIALGASPPPQPSQDFPMVMVEAAFGAQPGDTTASVDYLADNEAVSWSDITSRVIGAPSSALISASRGRQYELSQEEAGELALSLDNHDGAFTPSNPGSPYYSNAINANMSFQSVVRPWTPAGNATLAQSAAQAFATGQGARALYSLRVTPDGLTAGPGATSEAANITVAAGRVASQVASSQLLTTSGSWTAPAGITSVGVECWGGGGGGGGAAATTGSAGGGGGGGGYANSVVTVNPGTPYPYTIGGGGAGGPGSGTQTVVQPYNSSTVWTCPSGVTSIKAECWGGGGTGGGTDGKNGGGGGGGGEYAAEATLAVTPGRTYTVSVGGPGQVSTFAGDTVTVTANPGGNASTSTAGAGGTGSTNTAHFNGGAGGAGSAHQNGGTGTSAAQGFTGSGGQNTYSWTAPAGVTSVFVIVGGGGGGGQGGGNSNNGYGGGGGGGGGLAWGYLTVTPGNTYTWFYGNGGTSGPGSGVSQKGGPGGDSSASGDSGTSLYAYGGALGGGIGAPGGAGGGASVSAANGGGQGGSFGGTGQHLEPGGGAGGGGGGGFNGTGQDGLLYPNSAAGGGDGGSGGVAASNVGGGNETSGGSGLDGSPGFSVGGNPPSPGYAGGGGGGGGGNNASTGAPGGGGGAGFVSWYYNNISFVPFGGGGGGSAAPGSVGGAGAGATSSGPGTGAAALSSGGAGGNGGQASTPAQAGAAPGGGGGGGNGSVGAQGGAGLVRLTYVTTTTVANGSAGGATSFGASLVVAGGGSGGSDGVGAAGAGGTGGSGSAGAVLDTGGSGAAGTVSGSGGGGGGAAGNGVNGNPGSGTSGGAAVTGAGAGGAGSSGTGGASTPATSPVGIGGGGGGGCLASGFNAGAAGAPGAIKLTFTPSGALSASAWLYSQAGWAAGGELAITWRGASGSVLAVSTSPPQPVPAAAWTQLTFLNVSAPPGAVSAALTVSLTGTPAASAVFYVAEAALAFGPQPVMTGLVRIMTPIRVTAWWQGRRYPVWFGYAERWPQDWPDLPQYGFSKMTATDAVAVASGNTMPSAMQGAILADSPYAYLPGSEQYTTATQGPTIQLNLTDANGLIALNYATGNQATGTFADGAAEQVSAGLALNLLGDQNTGIGTTAYQSQGLGTRGPSLFYTDPALPVNGTGSGFTTEFWFGYGGTAQLCTLFTMYGPPSSFFARTGHANGAMLSVTASGTALTVATAGGVSIAVPFAASDAPQHFALAASAASGLATVYLNGQPQGNITLPLANQVTCLTLGPGRFAYDCNSAASYSAFNYVAGHLAIYDYQLTQDRIAAHFATGVLGAAGVTAAQRFAQILTWGQAGLKRGAYWWASAAGSPEVTEIGPAYSLNGSSAADAVSKLQSEEGGRFAAQANGSLVYAERWAGYNKSATAAFGDAAPGADPELNPQPAFGGGVGPWTAVNGTVAVTGAVSYIGAQSLQLTPAGSPSTVAAARGGMTPVTPGASYTMSAWVNIPTGWSFTQAGFDWFDGNGQPLSTSAVLNSVAPGSWTLVSAQQTAPPGAVFGTVRVGLAATPSQANVLYLSYASMRAAAAEVPFPKETAWDFDNTYTYSEVTAVQQYGPNQLILADVRDPASQQQYFRRSALSHTAEVVSPYDVSDVTTWSLARFSQPVLHTRSLIVDAAATPHASFSVVLGLDIGDVITVTRRPVGGAEITEAGIIEHVGHSIGPGMWQVTYQLSPYAAEAAVLAVDGPATSALPQDNNLGW